MKTPSWAFLALWTRSPSQSWTTYTPRLQPSPIECSAAPWATMRVLHSLKLPSRYFLLMLCFSKISRRKFGCSWLSKLLQCSSRLVLSHESCQKWLHRLLYGRLQLMPRMSFLPRWWALSKAVIPIGLVTKYSKKHSLRYYELSNYPNLCFFSSACALCNKKKQ